MGRIPPLPQRMPAQEYQDRKYGFVWASTTGQPSPSHWCPGSAIRQVAESPGTWHVPVGRSRRVYTTYTESCSDPAWISKLLYKSTLAPGQVSPVPSSAAATPSSHLCSLHDLFLSYDRLQSAKHSCSWPALQVLKGRFRTHVGVT